VTDSLLSLSPQSYNLSQGTRQQTSGDAMNDPIEGGCLCGAIRYRAMSKPIAATLCHCRSCRLAAGAPSVAWAVFRAADFAFIAGQPREFASSHDVVRTFCGTCGTTLTYRRMSKVSTIDVTTATLDAANDFAPAKEIWVEEKISWEPLSGHIPRYYRSSVGAMPIDPP
jgi:hypothetical protein